jgi:hypothetical protein
MNKSFLKGNGPYKESCKNVKQTEIRTHTKEAGIVLNVLNQT